jgi:hypothetical protein
MVGSSDGLKVRQAAFSIGNPFGLYESLISGIISGVERRRSNDGQEITKAIQPMPRPTRAIRLLWGAMLRLEAFASYCYHPRRNLLS